MSNNKFDSKESVLVITISLFLFYRLTQLEWFIDIALVVGLLGLFSNSISKKISLIWVGLNKLLSLIVPTLLLSFVFYLFLTPIALLSKIFKTYDHLILKNTDNSLFKTKTTEVNKKSFEQPF